jgi:hypothetical protein
MKENLILSAVHDLEYDALAPFLESLRATGSKARVHLFLSGVSAKSRKKIESLDVTTETFRYLHFRTRRPLLWLWPVWKRLLASRDAKERCRMAKWVFKFVSLRHVLYYDYLLSCPKNDFENVLLVDSRDVYFQRDPFSDNLGSGLHCFLEASTQTIGKCPYNRRMVLSAFGPDILAQMADAPVSCAGATLGDINSILGYLKTMTDLLCKIEKMTNTNDQGVHNFLIQSQLLPYIHLHDNYSSSVFTAGCEGDDRISLNERDEIVRKDGKAYPILHQYDRREEICRKLLGKLEATKSTGTNG